MNKNEKIKLIEYRTRNVWKNLTSAEQWYLAQLEKKHAHEEATRPKKLKQTTLV